MQFDSGTLDRSEIISAASKTLYYVDLRISPLQWFPANKKILGRDSIWEIANANQDDIFVLDHILPDGPSAYIIPTVVGSIVSVSSRDKALLPQILRSSVRQLTKDLITIKKWDINYETLVEEIPSGEKLSASPFVLLSSTFVHDDTTNNALYKKQADALSIIPDISCKISPQAHETNSMGDVYNHLFFCRAIWNGLSSSIDQWKNTYDKQVESACDHLRMRLKKKKLPAFLYDYFHNVDFGISQNVNITTSLQNLIKRFRNKSDRLREIVDARKDATSRQAYLQFFDLWAIRFGGEAFANKPLSKLFVGDEILSTTLRNPTAYNGLQSHIIKRANALMEDKKNITEISLIKSVALDIACQLEDAQGNHILADVLNTFIISLLYRHVLPPALSSIEKTFTNIGVTLNRWAINISGQLWTSEELYKIRHALSYFYHLDIVPASFNLRRVDSTSNNAILLKVKSTLLDMTPSFDFDPSFFDKSLDNYSLEKYNVRNGSTNRVPYERTIKVHGYSQPVHIKNKTGMSIRWWHYKFNLLDPAEHPASISEMATLPFPTIKSTEGTLALDFPYTSELAGDISAIHIANLGYMYGVSEASSVFDLPQVQGKITILPFFEGMQVFETYEEEEVKTRLRSAIPDLRIYRGTLDPKSIFVSEMFTNVLPIRRERIISNAMSDNSFDFGTKKYYTIEEWNEKLAKNSNKMEKGIKELKNHSGETLLVFTEGSLQNRNFPFSLHDIQKHLNTQKDNLLDAEIVIDSVVKAPAGRSTVLKYEMKSLDQALFQLSQTPTKIAVLPAKVKTLLEGITKEPHMSETAIANELVDILGDIEDSAPMIRTGLLHAGVYFILASRKGSISLPTNLIFKVRIVVQESRFTPGAPSTKLWIPRELKLAIASENDQELYKYGSSIPKNSRDYTTVLAANRYLTSPSLTSVYFKAFYALFAKSIPLNSDGTSVKLLMPAELGIYKGVIQDIYAYSEDNAFNQLNTSCILRDLEKQMQMYFTLAETSIEEGAEAKPLGSLICNSTARFLFHMAKKGQEFGAKFSTVHLDEKHDALYLEIYFYNASTKLFAELEKLVQSCKMADIHVRLKGTAGVSPVKLSWKNPKEIFNNNLTGLESLADWTKMAIMSIGFQGIVGSAMFRKQISEGGARSDYPTLTKICEVNYVQSERMNSSLPEPRPIRSSIIKDSSRWGVVSYAPEERTERTRKDLPSLGYILTYINQIGRSREAYLFNALVREVARYESLGVLKPQPKKKTKTLTPVISAALLALFNNLPSQRPTPMTQKFDAFQDWWKKPANITSLNLGVVDQDKMTKIFVWYEYIDTNFVSPLSQELKEAAIRISKAAGFAINFDELVLEKMYNINMPVPQLPYDYKTLESFERVQLFMGRWNWQDFHDNLTPDQEKSVNLFWDAINNKEYSKLLQIAIQERQFLVEQGYEDIDWNAVVKNLQQ